MCMKWTAVNFMACMLFQSLGAERSLKMIPWMKVKCVKVTKGCLDEVEVKEQYNEAYKKMPLIDVKRPERQRRCTSRPTMSADNVGGHFCQPTLSADNIGSCLAGADKVLPLT